MKNLPPLLAALLLWIAPANAQQAANTQQAASTQQAAPAPAAIPDEPDYSQCYRYAPGQAADPTPDTDSLRIGVRQDARPFSYFSEEMREVWSSGPPGRLAQRKYTGYITKICDAVLADMLLSPAPGAEYPEFDDTDIAVLDTDCLMDKKIRFLEDKRTGQENDPVLPQSRFEFLGDQIDILCDPATISNARRHGFIISPPVFLTGIGMIKLKGAALGRLACPKGKALIGHVGNTNAGYAGLLAVLNAQELASFRQSIIGHLNGNRDICKPPFRTGQDAEEYQFIRTFPNHTEAARAFCDGKFHFYLGDREIISENARDITGCEIEGAGRTYSDDRYAIFGKIDYANPTRALRTARFFEILSQKIVVSDSVLDNAFSTTFIGTEPSQKLQSFFWNIRGPK